MSCAAGGESFAGQASLDVVWGPPPCVNGMCAHTCGDRIVAGAAAGHAPHPMARGALCTGIVVGAWGAPADQRDSDHMVLGCRAALALTAVCGGAPASGKGGTWDTTVVHDAA